MEWDSWPNEGYPCAQCGQIGQCEMNCTLRQNDRPSPKNICPECRCSDGTHLASPPGCKRGKTDLYWRK